MFVKFCLFFLTTVSLAQANITWQPSVDISQNNFSDFPVVALDSQGNAVAAWRQSVAPLEIFASTKVLGQNWITQVIFSPSPTAVAVGPPAVAVDALGNALVVWDAGPVPGADLFFATKPFGHLWSTPGKIAINVDNGNPVITIDFQNTARVIWENAPGATSTVWVSEAVSPWTSWSIPQLLSGVSTDSLVPDMAIDPAGNTIAVWKDSASIVSANKPFGQPWNLPAITISSGATNYSPKVAIDSNGNAVAIWASNAGVQTATKLFNQPWSPPVIFPGSSTDSLSAPQIAVDPQGNAIATWANLPSTAIMVAQKPFGQSWTLPIVLNLLGPPGGSPQIAIDPCGNAVITAGNPNVYSKLAGHPNFSTFTNVGTGGDTQVAMNPCGHIQLVWQSNTGIIEADEGNFVTHPSNITGLRGKQKTNDFGTVQEFFNHIQWDHNTSPLIVGYNIYRNSVLIKTVGHRVNEYNDQDRKKGKLTTYGVSALLYTGREGSIATVIVK